MVFAGNSEDNDIAGEYLEQFNSRQVSMAIAFFTDCTTLVKESLSIFDTMR